MPKLLFDAKLKRPACILLQAVIGGDSGALYKHFSSEDWLVHPTPDMKVWNGTDEQWASMAKVTAKGRPYKD